MQKLVVVLLVRVLVVTCVLLPSVASSQKPIVAHADGGNGYRPGLGEMMLLAQARHMKLWLAGVGGNWELADYQIDELKEGLDDAAKSIPTYKGIPIAPMIDATMMPAIAALEAAIKQKDITLFEASFETLTAQCNVCHQSANKPFIVIQKPVDEPFPNQSFKVTR